MNNEKFYDSEYTNRLKGFLEENLEGYKIDYQYGSYRYLYARSYTTNHRVNMGIWIGSVFNNKRGVAMKRMRYGGFGDIDDSWVDLEDPDGFDKILKFIKDCCE